MKEKSNHNREIPILSHVVKALAFVVVWLIVAVIGFGKGLVQMAWEGIFKKTNDGSPSSVSLVAESKADLQTTTVAPDTNANSNVSVIGKISLIIHRVDLANGEKLVFKYYELPLDVFTIEQKLPGIGFKGRAGHVGRRLNDFTRNDALKNDVDFTMESVVRFTLAQRNVNPLVRSNVPKPPPATSAVNTEHSTPTEVISTSSQSAPMEVFKEAEGTVISAGKATVKLPKKPAFDVFEVVIQKESGERVNFNGERLKAIFMESKFGIGDYVLVTQFAKETISSTGNDGKSNTYSVNPFTVKVIQQAHA